MVSLNHSLLVSQDHLYLPCSELILHLQIRGWPHGVVDIAGCGIGGGGGGGIVTDLQWKSILSRTSRFGLSFCNGLFMYCYAPSPSSTLDHYFVINLVTGQQAAIALPVKTSLVQTYAALAYDPSESCFFRIVQFQGLRCLNVYDSETRHWRKLLFLLEHHVVMAEWIKECVLLRGAIYRLSMSGHLLRFLVDRKLSLEYQACAIDLPAVAKKWLNGCIGLSNDRIKFMAFDKNLCLCIWVLTGTYEWSIVQRLSKSDAKCDFENNFYKPLGFHPYSDIIFLGLDSPKNGSGDMSFDFGKDNSTGKKYLSKSRHIFKFKNHCCGTRWHSVVAYPILYCDVSTGLGDNPTNHDGQPNSIFGHGVEELLRTIKDLHNELSTPPSLFAA